MHVQQFWSEWDGRGYEDAVAYAIDWIEDPVEALRDIRRLGIDARDVHLIQGWVGSVDGDIILSACHSDGTCVGTEDERVDDVSLMRVTFAFLLVQ